MKKTLTIILLITAVILTGAAVILLSMGPQTVMARLMGAAVPADGLDTATTRLTDQGLFKVSYSSSAGAIPINQIHSWTLHVETAGGQTVEQAEITVDGGMPQHGHGLPTQPRVTEYLGEGNFLIEGLRFNMPGWWEVTFHIAAGDERDSVTFNLVLN
jgi:hypothetical protein